MNIFWATACALIIQKMLPLQQDCAPTIRFCYQDTTLLHGTVKFTIGDFFSFYVCEIFNKIYEKYVYIFPIIKK